MTLISSTYWGGMPFDFRAPPERADVQPVKLRTEDLRELRGLRWSPRGRAPRAGVLLMHPRVDFSRHYAIPRLLDAGFEVLALGSRNRGDDHDTVHEELVRDVAAGVQDLRRRVDRVALLGNSGGGSLMALYAEQAAAAPDARIGRTPAGAPTGLARATLPPVDLLLLVAAHRGQGHVLLRAIDPSVVCEGDPAATDDSLDMYAPQNGFAEPPAPSTYTPDFVQAYRAAQRARVERLDAAARALLAPMREARRALKAPGFHTLAFAERQAVERAVHTRHVMLVHRTMANLDYTDATLDPSPRGYGSLLSERPDLMNRSLPGFGRIVTPRAWLSTWSGLSSNADLCRSLAGVEVPVLAVHAERDKEIFAREDFAAIRASVASADRTFEVIEGAGHYFEPPFGETAAPHVEALMDVVVPWLEARL